MARPAPHRILLNLALDGVLAAAALPLALWLAAGGWPGLLWWVLALPGAVLALGAVAFPLGLPRQYWRYAGLQD